MTQMEAIPAMDASSAAILQRANSTRLTGASFSDPDGRHLAFFERQLRTEVVAEHEVVSFAGLAQALLGPDEALVRLSCLASVSPNQLLCARQVAAISHAIEREKAEISGLLSMIASTPDPLDVATAVGERLGRFRSRTVWEFAVQELAGLLPLDSIVNMGHAALRENRLAALEVFVRSAMKSAFPEAGGDNNLSSILKKILAQLLRIDRGEEADKVSRLLRLVDDGGDRIVRSGFPFGEHKMRMKAARQRILHDLKGDGSDGGGVEDSAFEAKGWMTSAANCGLDIAYFRGLVMTAVPDFGGIDLTPEAADSAFFLKIARHGETAIPRKVHQIWIGHRPPPEASIGYWRKYCARYGYEHHLWREEDLARIGVLDLSEYQYYVRKRIYAAAVDVARIHVVASEGGLYVDCDIIPYDVGYPMHELLAMRGLMLLPAKTMRDLGRGAFFCTNAMFASTAGHPVLEVMKAAIPKAIAALGHTPAWWITGACLLTWVARGSFSLVDPLLIGSSPASSSFDQVIEDLGKQSRERLILFCQYKEWSKKELAITS